MQNSTTIIGIIEMRLKGISYDDCRNRYGVGNSTVNLIMSRYRAKGIPLEVLKQMPGSEVEDAFYPPSNIRRKSEDIMPDYEAIYTRINQEGSKANLYFMWLRYKKDHPSGYQYTQFCHYFNQYVNTHHGSQSLRMAVERIPGERVYIDWVGDQPELLVDAQTGELRKVHAELLIGIYNSSFYSDYVKYGECPAYGKSKEAMERSIRDYPKFIILHNGKSVGCISCRKKEMGIYEVGCLCVIPEYQGKGIGTQAIKFVTSYYEDWDKFTLITPIDKKENVKFYTEKCGFDIVSTEMDGNVRVSRFVLER